MEDGSFLDQLLRLRPAVDAPGLAGLGPDRERATALAAAGPLLGRLLRPRLTGMFGGDGMKSIAGPDASASELNGRSSTGFGEPAGDPCSIAGG